MIESLVDMVRGAAFLMPGALGAQEGTFVVLGGLFGLRPDQALAVSLIRRVRELAIGLPGLIAWQVGKLRRATAGERKIPPDPSLLPQRGGRPSPEGRQPAFTAKFTQNNTDYAAITIIVTSRVA